MRKRAMAIALILSGVLLFQVQAFAYTTIQEEKDVTLTLTYELPEISFRLFRVADVSKTATYTLTETFKNYPVTLENSDSEGWRDVAQTLAEYVEQDKIVPSITGETDESGKLVLKKLEKGMYLVIGESHTTEEKLQYDVMPFMVSLPMLTPEDEWDYEPVVSPKYGVKELQSDNTHRDTTAEEKLPQTGQLWWPVPVLITVGVLLLVAGILQRKRG